jgi:hypothetical protein
VVANPLRKFKLRHYRPVGQLRRARQTLGESARISIWARGIHISPH